MPPQDLSFFLITSQGLQEEGAQGSSKQQSTMRQQLLKLTTPQNIAAIKTAFFISF
ncbi:hypothetical protein X556_0213 [Chlamydia pneumoniae B21]|nr:hypothetical protein X556_0213 [Chlamydia pneumoniae B21]